jgi:hypothetical protein
MTSVEKIENQLNIALAEYGKADKKLNDWEEGVYKGKRLIELGEKLYNEEWKNEVQKKGWEEMVGKLEEEKKLLEKEKGERWKQAEYLQKKLVEFGEGEGNEQIA